MITKTFWEHINSILEFIKDNRNVTDSIYHTYTLVNGFFYYLYSDLRKLFKSINFDIKILTC